MDRPPPGKVEDLATLAKLDEQVLLNELKIRYNNNEIYVSVHHIHKTIHLLYGDTGVSTDHVLSLRLTFLNCINFRE